MRQGGLLPIYTIKRNDWLWGWVLTGLILIAFHGGLLCLSLQFSYGQPLLARPVRLMAGLMVGAGGVYLGTVCMLRRQPARGMPWLIGMLAAGLAMRLLLMFSNPMLEDDFYRYLWDGAVVANGHSPYAHAPQTVMDGKAPASFRELALDSGDVLARVNHPQLSTIYPPVAQAAFAAAYHVSPWRILGLRIVWMVADIATAGLLVLLLRTLKIPSHLLLVYWWNPLLVKEVYNSAHMDILVLPFVVGALLLAVRNRRISSAALLGLGAGVKLWPVLLLPLLLRSRKAKLPQQFAAVTAFLGVALVVTLPVLLTAWNEGSGLAAYARRWEMNDSLFMVLSWLARVVTAAHHETLARILVAALLIGWMLWLCRKPARDGRQLCERALWAVAALFMLSPTQFSWYWLWMLPLLVTTSSPGLLILTATLPLYYLRFYLKAVGHVQWFDYGVVWIEFGPALVLLAWQAWRSILHSRENHCAVEP